MGIINLIKTFHKGKLTKKQADILCDEFPMKNVERETGMGTSLDNDACKHYIKALNRAFPPYKFRFIICHNRERTYFTLTRLNPDPREYSEMIKHGDWDYDGCYIRRTK